MNTKFFGVVLFAVAAQAAPAADADADAQVLLGAPAATAYHVAPTNCKLENEILVTQACTPSVENVCTKETVDTEEIEYVKVCKDVVDKICDNPAVATHLVKRDADAEADPQFLAAPYGHLAHAAVAPVVAPVAHAVAHAAVATVKHACREVTTQHCVDNPVVKIVPVEVEHCHTVTKVTCSDVENAIPKTTCEPVETTHVAGYALPHVAAAAYHY